MMRIHFRVIFIGFLLLFEIVTSPVQARSGRTELNAYAEWRHDNILIVDGQRILMRPNGKLKGSGEAKSFDTIPLGYEVKIKGDRLTNGMILASEVKAKPNDLNMFEGELKEAFDQMEAEYRKQGRVTQAIADGKVTDMGALLESGPEVDRVRNITARLTPPYLKPEDFRVYVIENEEWNAMAAPNRSIYVFSGLLNDMNDDEVAIILGHELVHATHEHSRKQYKSSLWIQLGAIGALGVVEGTVDNSVAKQVTAIVTVLGMSAWVNGYSRDHEDQADRVGLRYAHEGGFDVYQGPTLWGRFAEKYGDPNKTLNFFFGNHSVAKDRQRNLQQEIELNYPRQ